jgi:K+-sensing histidine kinase KdpD
MRRQFLLPHAVPFQQRPELWRDLCRREGDTAGEQSTGLGLAIVKQLAEMHDANIEVVSKPGEGSLFRVAFPLVR